MAPFILSTDSGCDLTKKLAKDNHIEILPMTYSIDETYYTDTMDSNDLAIFYQKMTEGSVPKTASVSIGAYIDHFKKIAKNGLPILHLTLGSGLSGTYSNGLQAVEMLKNEGFENEIILIDSNCASLGYGLMVLEAAKMRDEGKSAEEVAKYIDDIKFGVSPYFTTPDLTYLYRGGRVSKTSMVIAHALGIRPILNLDHEGRLGVCDKVRGERQCWDKMAQHINSMVVNPAAQTLYVSHSLTPDLAKKLAEHLKEKVGFKDICYTEIGTIVGAHTGPGLVAVFFHGKERTGSYAK
ncbi:MAG: DegV family protein [Clostridia bacterium]|nr:DegV family protein [Clostridia bacterium]